MSLIFEKLKRHYQLSEQSISELKQALIPRVYKKKSIILDIGSPDVYTYFIESGLVRGFYIINSNIYTASLDLEGLLGSYPGLSTEKNAFVGYETLEDSVLYRAPRELMENIYLSSLEMVTWARRLTEEKISYYDSYFRNYHYEDKTIQYQKLLSNYPELIKRVPLKDLATYLDVTPQSLSRIRASGTKL